MSWGIALEAAVNSSACGGWGRPPPAARSPVVFPVGPRRDVAALASEARA